MRRHVPAAALVLLVPVVAVASVPVAWGATTTSTTAAATSITVNATSGGRTFDGVGAISGGGGNSRLLVDYPEPQRGQILDYLFKPGVGASLQILKVEVGGDTNSTDGAEPSHMHTRTDLNCDRGYEWWLMAQAKARNPGVKLAALSWGLPGWAGGSGHTFWTQDTIDYLIKWLDCARSHNLTIDYIGGWNEKGFDKTWYENFHAALAAKYPAVKLVGDDGNKGWLVADAMAADATFTKAVDVLGIHYSCGYTSTTAGRTCLDSANARATGKPLWASETGSQDYNTGAFASARTYIHGYIDARMTGYLNWPVIAALTPNLRFATDGVMVANQPWSGAYSVGKSAWTMAHTTQFTAPGWRYQDSASGYLGGDRMNGGYVTLRSPNGKDYSTIVETVDATATQTLSVTVAGGLSTGTVHVWATDVNSGNPADWFVHTTDLTPSGGKFTVSLKPGFLYSITTTTGQGKGTAKPPAGHGLALPYTDSFDGYPVGHEARYLADMDGAFEIVNCGGGRAGQCVRQMAPQQPVVWRNGNRDPSALLGDLGWKDYTARADVLLEHTGYVELQGRVGTQGHDPSLVNAYFLRVTDKGAWSIVKSTQTTPTTLASGTATALGTNSWHTLALAFKGTAITASVDGTKVGSVTDASYTAGQVGIATSQTINAQFDNLAVATGAAPPTISGTYKLINKNSGLALSVVGGSSTDGALIEQATDSGATSRQWVVTPVNGGFYKLVNRGSGLALDVPGGSATAGTRLDQHTDNGSTGEQWQLTASGDTYTLTSRASGLVADVKSHSTVAGAPVIEWPANNGTNQQWQLVQVT
jgi:O-glycosyl hydrolase